MRNHKILSFLLALVISVCLWVYAVTIVNPDDTLTLRDVKVRIIGSSELQSRNLILTGGLEQYVDVVVSGRRSDLKELSSSNVEAIADVSNIDRAGSLEVSWTLEPPASVASGDIRVVSSSSNKVMVKVSTVQEKNDVPVELQYIGEIDGNYVRDPATQSVTEISVRGPEEEVSNIAKAIVTVDLTDATQTITQDLPYILLDTEGELITPSQHVTLSHETIRVSVPILCYKQVPLRVSLIPGGGATEENVEISIDPPTIGVTGPEDVLAALDEIVLKEIDLATVVDGQTWTVVPNLPSGVTNRASDPSVQITLAYKNLSTKKLTVMCSNIIRLDNIETLAFGEQSISVIVRGPSEVVRGLTASNLRVTADMYRDYDSATRSVTVKVTMPSDCAAGVVGGPYTVQVIEVPPETSSSETETDPEPTEPDETDG